MDTGLDQIETVGLGKKQVLVGGIIEMSEKHVEFNDKEEWTIWTNETKKFKKKEQLGPL